MDLQLVGMFLGISSSLLLLAGCLFLLLPKRRKKNGLVLVYVTLLFLLEASCNLHAVLYGTQNLYLFSVSAYLHFAFLTYIYCKKLIGLPLWKYLPIILLGMLPLFWTFSSETNLESFQSMDRSLYSFAIMLYGLSYWYILMKRRQLHQSKLLRFNVVVISFFSIDAFLAVGTNFLVNESLTLVAGFWIARALLLLLYYWSVINYLWRIGKTPPRLSYG